MGLQDYFKVFRARWLLIVCSALIGVALAALLTWRTTPVYSSSTGLFISTSQASDDSSALQGSQFSMQRVKSYARMVPRTAIMKRVIERLDLDETPTQLEKRVTASSELDTVLLNITVTDPSPERAQQIATTTAEVFIGYVGELETPPGTDEATVKATVVDDANLPQAPSSPNTVRNLGLGAAAGLLLGLGLAVLLDALDTSVRGRRELENLAGAPIIGAIPFDKGAADTPLVSDLDPYSPRVEAFRMLRTNLQFIEPGARTKTFIITSALPAEGKSTTACNLALTLADGGQRVLLIEGDLRRPRVAQYFGLVQDVGLTTVLVGRIDIDDAIQSTAVNGLDVVSSGRTPPNPAELLQSPAMSDVLTQLRGRYDVILIDAPPLLPVTDAAVLTAHADGAILVVRHGHTTQEQVRGAVEILAGVDTRPVAALFSMVPQGSSRSGYGYGYGYAPVDGTASSFSRPPDDDDHDASAAGADRSFAGSAPREHERVGGRRSSRGGDPRESEPRVRGKNRRGH